MNVFSSIYLVHKHSYLYYIIQHKIKEFIKVIMMPGNNTSERIELHISCRNLKDLDYFSKSDPYIKVYFRRDFTVKQYALYGRTETQNNQLNPNFKTTFEIDYIFQSRQDIRFDVLDDDNGNDDFIGSCETTIGALMGAKNQTSVIDLTCEGKPRGKLVVRCQKVTQSNNFMRMKYRAQKLMNTDSFFDFWDKSDPYLKFLKLRDDNTYIEVARTNTVQNNLNPSWNPVDIQMQKLVNEKAGAFRIECWDWEEDGKDNFIGECLVKLEELKNSKGPMELNLSNPKKKKPGVIILEHFQMVSRPSFIDYLRGGLELNMIIAVDFTGSNGTPTSPSSLHYMNPSSPNQYQSAIMAITGILMNYDSDKRIPCFGFGADLHFPNYPKGTSHCFPLSGQYNSVQSTGVEQLLAYYANALMNLSLSGPTYFGPILKETMKLASICRQQGSRTYQTLLILTDGEIHDMEETIDLIFEAATLPLSIIIVGVGNDSFSNMVRLDGDGGTLFNSKGQKVPRDIVQFVPFRDAKFNQELLAKQLLAELPGQIVQYMSMAGIVPAASQEVNIDHIAPIKPLN